MGRVSVGEDEMKMFWRWVVMGGDSATKDRKAQCERTSRQWTVHLQMVKMVNFMECTFCHAKKKSSLDFLVYLWQKETLLEPISARVLEKMSLTSFTNSSVHPIFQTVVSLSLLRQHMLLPSLLWDDQQGWE